MKLNYNPRYPDIEQLRRKAKQRMPRFAFEYLDGGCNEDVNLARNTAAVREVLLKPRYLQDFAGVDMRIELFGHTYDAPFGIAPVGLQGLIWPNAPEILAKAAFEHNVPFILSTVSTSPIERIMDITEGQAWFQLYHPAEDHLRNDLLHRAWNAGCQVLVILCDVPSFGFRPRDIRNGLAMPPRMNLDNILQVMGRPAWAWQTLKHGQPSFATMKKYMPKGLNMKQLGAYMNQTFSGRINPSRIAEIRARWPGKLVLKGVEHAADAELAVRMGLDGIIVSNHGGRQLDAAEASISALPALAAQYGGRIKVMLDSGLRSGPDIARGIASGASFCFLGRTPMYGVGALGKAGGEHILGLLKAQLRQVMDQLGCARTTDLPGFLLRQGLVEQFFEN